MAPTRSPKPNHSHHLALAGRTQLAIAQLAMAGLAIAGLGTATGARAQAWAGSTDPLTGPRAPYSKDWIGTRPVEPTTEILVMAGHSDAQGIGGAGTGGAAASLYGARPMQIGITDELFWNLVTAQEVVRLGQTRGLKIRFYDPPQRSIANGNDPRTTWSVGKAHVQAGGYALEIHHDAHGSAGIGSGLIPPISTAPTSLDESLASAFGAFPRWFRDGLGGPRRGIAILEIGKLEGQLETNLRNPGTRQATIETIAQRVVLALERGVAAQPAQTALGAVGTGVVTDVVSPPPDVVGSVPPAQDPRASSGAW